MPDAAAPAPAVMVLLLVRYRRAALAWGLGRLVLGRWGLGRPEGLRFARVLGSGRDGGFGIVPGLRHQGLVAFFDDEAAARRFIDGAPVLQAYERHADELLVGLMRAHASRGSWGGVSLATSLPAQTGGPVAALTRASIRPRHALRFWRHTPATEQSLREASGCRLAVGLGEAPLLRQATFSLWDDAASMEAYARHGAHRAASAGARLHDWFSESMFVRLVPLLMRGRWHGQAWG